MDADSVATLYLVCNPNFFPGPQMTRTATELDQTNNPFRPLSKKIELTSDPTTPIVLKANCYFRQSEGHYSNLRYYFQLTALMSLVTVGDPG